MIWTVHAASPEALRDLFCAFVGQQILRLEGEVKRTTKVMDSKALGRAIYELKELGKFFQELKIETPKRTRQRKEGS